MKIPQKEIDWAVRIAEKLPEKFQQSGFSELLRYAITHIDKDDPPQEKTSKQPVLKIPKTIASDIFPDLHLLATQGNRDQHVAWAVAELHLRNEDVNNNSIRQIIKEYLAIAPPSRQNANRSLRNLTPKYIVRTRIGRNYHYVPASRFAEIFKDLKDKE